MIAGKQQDLTLRIENEQRQRKTEQHNQEDLIDSYRTLHPKHTFIFKCPRNILQHRLYPVS